MKVSYRPVAKRVRVIPEAIAAKLVRRFAINPFSNKPSPNLAGLSDEERQSLEQIMQDVGTTAERLQNPEVRSRVVAALTASLGSGARSLLGDEGSLPTAQYAIAFVERFEFFVQLGERRHRILTAIQGADATQHLTFDAPGFAKDGKNAWTLFTKRIGGSGGSFTLLVVGVRKGSAISIEAVWRVYDAQHGAMSHASPIDVLKVFLEKYGIPFTLARSFRRNFVDHEAFVLPPDLRGILDIDRLIKVERSGDDMFDLSGAYMPEAPGEKIHLWMTYAVNVTKYRADLARMKT